MYGLFSEPVIQHFSFDAEAQGTEGAAVHFPLEGTLGRILWLALEALDKTEREQLFVEYMDLLKTNLRRRPPRCILDGLPTYLQQEMELATFKWQPRFTWENLGADEGDMKLLYSTRVIKLAEKYYREKHRQQALSRRPTSDGGERFYACLHLLHGQVPLANLLGSYIGTPIHVCHRCTNAFALASKDTYMVFFWFFPWNHRDQND